MSLEIEYLESERRVRRMERDDALEQLRDLRKAATKSHRMIVAAFFVELKESSAAWRLRIENYLELEAYENRIQAAGELLARRLDATADGFIRELALTELRMLVSNEIVLAINKELTRIQIVSARRLQERKMASVSIIGQVGERWAYDLCVQ